MIATLDPINIDGELQVLCDPQSSQLAEFTRKFHEFRDTLSSEERDYLDFIRRSADVAAVDHGKKLLDDIDSFETRIEHVLGTDYIVPEAGGAVIRTTVVFRCATWLLQC